MGRQIQIQGRCRCGREGRLFHFTELGGPLCERCFPRSIQRRVEQGVRRYRMIPKGVTAAVAVSGGKDSGGLLHILGEVRRRLNFGLVAVHVDMELGEYSHASRRVCEEVAAGAGVALHTAAPSEWGVRAEPTRRWPICAVCGGVRRAILPILARRAGADVLCTGHTLDDQLVYALKDLLSGRAHPPRPVLPATPGFPQKAKPLFYLPEEAMRVYCELQRIPTVPIGCPRFVPATHRFKQVFEHLESLAPMGKQQLLHSLSRFIVRPEGPGREEHPCPRCGIPTTFDPCPLCRLREAQADASPPGRES